MVIWFGEHGTPLRCIARRLSQMTKRYMVKKDMYMIVTSDHKLGRPRAHYTKDPCQKPQEAWNYGESTYADSGRGDLIRENAQFFIYT